MRCTWLLGLCAASLAACGTRGDTVAGDAGGDATSGMDARVDTGGTTDMSFDAPVDSPGYDADLPDGTCAAVTVATNRTTPNVMFIIDRSGSMLMTFSGGLSRWDTEQDAIVGAPDGIVTMLQHEVRFG